MRWSDERYVRFYTRDSTHWLLGPWEARAVLGPVLRKLERDGTLDLGDDGLEALAVVVGLPPAVVEPGMAWWMRKGTFEIVAGRLVMPHFIEAQEARMSDAQRAREHRERSRDQARAGGSHVTERDSTVTKRDESITNRDGLSHGVTPSLPCRAVPPEPAGPPEPAPEPPAVTKRDETRSLRRPPSVVGFETTYLIAAYERAATERLKHAFVIDRSEYGVDEKLAAVVAHCPADRKHDTQGWLETEVDSFLRVVKNDAQWVGGYGPKAMLRWLNEGRQGASRSNRPELRRLDVRPPGDPLEAVPVEIPPDAVTDPKVIAEHMAKIEEIMRGAGTLSYMRANDARGAA